MERGPARQQVTLGNAAQRVAAAPQQPAAPAPAPAPAPSAAADLLGMDMGAHEI